MSGLSPAFWSGKRVLVTGHTGFKGGWLVAMLAEMGAEIGGYALPPDTEPCLFDTIGVKKRCRHVVGDIRDAAHLKAAVAGFDPEIVVHMAAQPLVRRSYREPLLTFETNVVGTANLLDACRGLDSLRVVVSVTTDKVYENHQWPWGYRENDQLGGHDPYSASKAAAELVTAAWRSSYLAAQGVRVATARAGNVIGGGDWSEDRIIPDAVRAFTRGESLLVRNPAAVRPWQHVVDPLTGYLMLAQALWDSADFAEGWNFGPEQVHVVPVRAVADVFCAAWGEGAGWHAPGESHGPHEAALLLLDSAKARSRLGWVPRMGLEEAVEATAHWYRIHSDHGSGPRLDAATRRTIADALGLVTA